MCKCPVIIIEDFLFVGYLLSKGLLLKRNMARYIYVLYMSIIRTLLKALQKLSQQFLLKRKFGAPPEIDGIDREQNRLLLLCHYASVNVLV